MILTWWFQWLATINAVSQIVTGGNDQLVTDAFIPIVTD